MDVRRLKKLNIRRVIPLLSALVVLVSCIVFPASAAPLPTVDYNDLITDVVVDGDNDLVTIVLPLDMVMLEGVDANGRIIGWCTADHTLPGLIKWDSYYIFRVSFYNFRLLAEDIPNFTQYTIACEVFHDGDPSTECYVTEASGRESYWDESGNRLYYEVDQPILTNQNMIGFHSFSGTINKPAGTHALELQQYFWGLHTKPAETRVFFRVDSFILTFSINSLLRLQQTSGKTNQILKEVEKQLAEQGKTLDDIRDQQEQTNEKLDDLINGTPEQNEQVDQAVDGMQSSTDKLGELGDTLNSVEKPDAGDIDVSINSLIPQTSLLAYTRPILAIWNNDTAVAMVMIVLTLVLISWVMFGKKG